MDSSDDIEKLLEVIGMWSSLSELSEFAIKRHGFGNSDGGFGITYPDDQDEYGIEIEKETVIQQGFVGAYGFWGLPDGYEFQISEHTYLEVLSKKLIDEGCNDEANKIIDTYGLKLNKVVNKDAPDNA
jgi:hypothetical protein